MGALVLLLAGCATNEPITDPLGTLGNPEATPTQQVRAIEALQNEPSTPETISTLRRILHQPGYTTRVREEALDELLRIDPDAALRTLAIQLPTMDALQWRRRVCEIVVERHWTEMTPTLVRAWSVPMPGWVDDDEDRPERQALEKLYGADKLPDVLFDLFITSDGVAEQNLRARCWELLIRIGERDRLVALLANANAASDDATIIDLRAAASDLGVIPVNREEILWIRALRQPQRAAYWSTAREAVAALGPEQRAGLELRDLAVVVATSRHHPEWLPLTTDQLANRIDAELSSPSAGRTHTLDFEGWAGDFPQTFRKWRSKLRWADMAAILLALEATRVEAVRDHLFDYADRDLKDRTCEYGGIIRLDDQGRYEVVEFRPRVRGNDERFDAPQDMIDAGYTALFHFHFHATSVRNGRYAAPAQGDMLYADSVRANALCFTFIDTGTMNVDFYRHGGVSVDLGEIRRPPSPRS